MKNRTQFKTVLLLTTFIAATIVGMVSCNNTQKPGDTVNGNASNADTIRNAKPDGDAQFLAKVAEINMEEIQLGQLAQQKSTTPSVKKLGEMMIEDHTKALSDLNALANKKSITIPTTLDSNAQADYKNLSNLTGKDFDKQYCDMMVNGHKGAIALFEKESTGAADADIRQMASATLPTLHKHLDHAMECQKECGAMNN